MLEPVISSRPVLAGALHLFNPALVALAGAHINRTTVKNIQACVCESVRIDERSGDIIKLIEARK